MADKSNPNMELWDNVKGVDRTFTKKIIGKSYKGDSPNPTYIIAKITEQLGPIGYRWGFEVEEEQIRYGKPHQIVTRKSEVMGEPDPETGKQLLLSREVAYEYIREEYHQVLIRFWQKDDDGIVHYFSSFGGTPMLYMTKGGFWMHDEDAAKKSLTDAYVKAASWLGACADIFLGLYDGKYSGDDASGPSDTPGPDKQVEKPKQSGTRQKSDDNDDDWS